MEWRIWAIKGGLDNFISFGSIEVRIVPEVSTISAATMFPTCISPVYPKRSDCSIKVGTSTFQ